MPAPASANADSLATSERWIVRNGVGVQIMETLAVGAFLTGLAVELGAANWMIGALAAIPHISQLAQLPALWSVEKLRNRRRIYLVSGMIARPMLVVIALAAMFLPASEALWVILTAFALRYTAGAFLSCAWNSWMRDLVPDNQMGRLFGLRQRKMIGVGILFSLLAAAFVDMWVNVVALPTTYAYGIVYCLAFLGGAYSVWCARRVFEPAMAPAVHTDIMTHLRKPFQERNYRRLIVFLASWNFAVNLAAPFFTVYLLRRLDYELTLVIGLATLSQVAAFLTVRNWGLIADRFSNKVVLRTCCPIFLLAIFAWTFTTMPEPHVLTLPLLVVLHVLTGVATAGVNLAVGNITLKLAPVGAATSYLAASSMVNALAAGTAALFGGVAVDLLSSLEVSLTLNWRHGAEAGFMNAMNISHWDFFFIFSAVVGLYSLHRLSLVREEGEIHESRVLGLMVDSARQGLKNLSTIAGLRAASGFPIDELQAGITPDDISEEPPHDEPPRDEPPDSPDEPR